jgi:hypothetical protein
MPCPYYKDDIRECLEEYFHLHQYNKTKYCESDEYIKCLVYLAVNSKIQCKYLDNCASSYDKKYSNLFKKIFDNENIRKFLYDMMTKYCFSENCVNCAKFKIYDVGDVPPLTLRPDGKKFHLSDILLKKEIVLE